MIFRINKYNYKTKIIIKICKLTCNNQMFGLRIFNQTKFKNLKFEIYKNFNLKSKFKFKKLFIKLLFILLKFFLKIILKHCAKYFTTYFLFYFYNF